MNLKTTFALIALGILGVVGWLVYDRQLARQPDPASETVTFLANTLKPEKIVRIDVLRGNASLFTLENSKGEWTMPGAWPTRVVETASWLDTLGKIHSRFAPLAISADADLTPFGLQKDPLTIKITLGDVTHTLRFGEEAGDTNRFTRPTYVRLDDKPEILRLGPGVLGALDRSAEYFQQRRLFATERVAKDPEQTAETTEKIEQVAAVGIAVETPRYKYALAEKNKEWTFTEIYRKEVKGWELTATSDRIDPAKLKAILAGIPDLWAESFVEGKANAAEFGLGEPEYILTVTRASGAARKLLIGKVSDSKTKESPKPPPPKFGMPPFKDPGETLEEHRYARLENNDRVFKVKADKLADIAPPPDLLRDARLARFSADDVKRLVVRTDGQELVFVKSKEMKEGKDKNELEKWRLEKPTREEIESRPVEELIEKLASLDARDRDILDQADTKALGLAKPSATLEVTVQEGKDDKKKSREIVFAIGANDKEANKAFVKVDAWPRVNRVADDVLKLARRPALAYRSRRVLDLAAADVKKIEIQRADETFAFERKTSGMAPDAEWKLAVPVAADVQAGKVDSLLNELARLEVVEFITGDLKQEEIDKKLGLANPKLRVTLHTKDGAKTLAIGNKRDGKVDLKPDGKTEPKSEYYARLDQGPIAVVDGKLRDELDRTSLSYRPTQIWQAKADTITEIAVERGKDTYKLKKDARVWKLTEPIQAEAMFIEIDEMADALAGLKCERFEAHQAKDLARFGLDKPAIKVQFAIDGKPRTLEVGKNADPLGKERYARLSGSEAILVLSERTVTPFDQAPFDLLDKTLLSLNPQAIQKIRVQGFGSFALEPTAKEKWEVVESAAVKFVAEENAVAGFLKPLTPLRAAKYVAFGAKIDWLAYGLVKPAVTIEVTLKSDDDKKKPEVHTLELGKETEAGSRYARLDKKDAVVVLGSAAAENLLRTHLDFLDTRVLKFDADALTGITRVMKDGDLELLKQEDQWRLVKPSPRDADNLLLGEVLNGTFRLQAKRIAAYPAKDLKPFGLDAPVAVVTLQLEAGKHVIKVGGLARNAARKDTDERFALVNDYPGVVVLSAELSRHLVAPVLYYADRNLASISSIDTVVIERGGRKTVFHNPSKKWQMTVPLKAGAEGAALDDLIRGVVRLRADEIVAEKDIDVKKYGLDQPFAQLRFKSGENEKLHLIVGAAENTQPAARRYARVGDKGPVFFLNAKLSAGVGEEFRARQPWPTFDAVSVGRITVTSPDKKFTFQKGQSSWIALGEPGEVDARKVSEMLDALASLQVLRYIADEKGDLALYGLAKPAWRIEFDTQDGKRALLLGRTEGASRRYYASVAGSGTVFVIDEADADRLARPLSAYVLPDKKPTPR